MSKVSGACTSMVGCSADGSFHALKRTPATYSPDRPVGSSGMRRPLQATTWRAGLKPVDLDLQPLDRGIDEARGAAGAALLAEHVPGLQRVAQLELDAAVGDRAVEREAEFALRVEPHRIERIAGAAQIAEHAEEILPDEMRAA